MSRGHPAQRPLPRPAVPVLRALTVGAALHWFPEFVALPRLAVGPVQPLRPVGPAGHVVHLVRSAPLPAGMTPRAVWLLRRRAGVFRARRVPLERWGRFPAQRLMVIVVHRGSV